MISGAHVVVYSKNAEADRAFFRDVLAFKSVDAGHGWLIFALPPAEAAFHPSEEDSPRSGTSKKSLLHPRRNAVRLPDQV